MWLDEFWHVFQQIAKHLQNGSFQLEVWTVWQRETNHHFLNEIVHHWAENRHLFFFTFHISRDRFQKRLENVHSTRPGLYTVNVLRLKDPVHL